MGSRTISVLLLILSTFVWTSTVSAAYLTQLEQNTLKEKGITLEDYSVDLWLLKSYGIPNHPTAEFPFEDNLNTNSEHKYKYLIPKNPVRLDTDENSHNAYVCLDKGVIAFASNGVPMFSPYSEEGFNVVEGPCSEVFDACNTHPDMLGWYHYRQFPNCLYDVSEQYTRLYGVALDGFPIYGPYEVNGTLVNESTLDECHGRTAENGRYEYRITFDFPYILGCYRGKPGSQLSSGSEPQGGSQMYNGSGPGSRSQGNSQMYSRMGSGSGAHNGSQMYSRWGSGSRNQSASKMHSWSGFRPQGGSHASNGTGQKFGGSGSGYRVPFSLPPFRRVSTNESEDLAAMMKELKVDARSNRVRSFLDKYYQSGRKDHHLDGLKQLLNEQRADSSCVKDDNWKQHKGVCPLKCKNPSLGCD